MAKDLGPKLTPEQIQLAQAWHIAKQDLLLAQEHERKLRARLCLELFEYGDDELRKGTERRDCGDGVSVKTQFGITRSFTDLDKVDKILDAFKRDPEGAIIEPRLIRVKYELNSKEYEMLPEHLKAMIDPVIQTRPSSPQVEIEFPKVR